MIQTEGGATYPAISDSQFGNSNYYVLNFNDNISALGTLYVLLLVNNMHVIATGYTAISYDIPVKTFFVCWYIVGVLFLLNLLTASLLSSFLSFWVAQKKIIYGTTIEENNNPILAAHDNTKRADSCESHFSQSLQKTSEISFQAHTLPDQEQSLISTRGRSQTVALNSMDDMFKWFHMGSSVWGGENLNVKEPQPAGTALSN